MHKFGHVSCIIEKVFFPKISPQFFNFFLKFLIHEIRIIKKNSCTRMTETPRIEGRLDLDKPRWVQDSYAGRAKHFFSVTDPRNIALSGSQLDGAKELLKLYR